MFTALPVGTGGDGTPSNTPHGISLALSNDGDGGTLYITSAPTPPAPADAVRPRTFFGAGFVAYPFIAFFDKTFLSAAQISAQFWRDYAISIYPLVASGPIPAVAVTNFSAGASRWLALLVTSEALEAGTGLWRMELRLRHTIGK